MKVIYYSLIIGAIFVSCNTKQQLRLKGIWIPEEVNWEDGSFETFYFYNDSDFILLSSTQKSINASIYFQAEPGFRLSDGRFEDIESKGLITFTTLYTFIKLPGEEIPIKPITAELILSIKENEVVSFQYRGIRFIKTHKYTHKSVQAIEAMRVKMVPQLLNNLNSGRQ